MVNFNLCFSPYSSRRAGSTGRKRCGRAMSEDGDVDVESAEDVPDIGVEATTTTTNGEYEVSGWREAPAATTNG